ncbi:HAMP domain-containing sensor histidine kinase [Bifidobacterium sp. CP2]|uniref:sensor histidine kinase n=1 Tax=Bifidobacterium sp. CP2 TaxID=2809025 RepID=UPI001F0B426F|nr:HAMP domain-containing sensor histidine kinase [Bifidobacterium sp. CP2]
MTDGNDTDDVTARVADRPPRRAWRRVIAWFARTSDKIRPRTFRAKLTLAISLVFLIALGSATLVQTLVVNGMFSYAMTITYENGQDGKEPDANGPSSSDGDYMSSQGWSVDPDPGTWLEAHAGANTPDLLGSMSGGNGRHEGSGSVSGRTDGKSYRVDWGGDGSFTITTPYGISVWNQDTVANGLRISAAIIFVFFGATSILVIWTVTSRMSKRLQSISDQTAALDPSDLGTRIDVTGGRTVKRRRWWNRRRKPSKRDRRDDEVTRLGDSINGMLDRIQAASEAERRFVSNASHELRTPIAAVETNLDAPLAQGRFPADVEPSVRRALAANRRGAELVGALLTLSRIQSGAYGKLGDGARDAANRTGMGSTDLAACVRDALADVDGETDARNIVVAFDVNDAVTANDDATVGPVPEATGLPPVVVKANPALLRLAVGNLIRNAVVHNTADGGSITVTIARDDDSPMHGDDRIRLTVGNTTDEQLPDDLDELVQPFHRGVNSRISAVSGVGLGLSIADAACDAMGAHLRLSSRTSEGCRTVFTATVDGLSALSGVHSTGLRHPTTV